MIAAERVLRAAEFAAERVLRAAKFAAERVLRQQATAAIGAARRRQKEVTAAKLREEMVAISKQVLTPATIESGLLMRLSGTTIRGHQIFSRSGLVASRTVVNQVFISLSDQYLKLVEKEIESSVNDHSKKVLVILDNYNILRWLKRVKAAVTKVKPVLLSFFPDTAS